MRFPTKSKMLDVQSRSDRGIAWRRIAVVVLGLLIYVMIRNYVYISGGLLKPDFRLVHKAYNFNFTELPLTLLCLSILLSVSALLWQKMRSTLFFVAALFVFFAIDLFALRYYVTYVEPQRLVVHHVRLKTAKLTKPFRILHISDIHAGAITDYEQRMFEQIKHLGPDMVLNTGDFLQVAPPATFESEFPKLLALIKKANPPFGTYAVFGDTENELYRIDSEKLQPLKLLSSRFSRVDTGGGTISLYGLSLYQSKNHEWAVRAVDEWLSQVEINEFRVLLGHAPDYALGMQDKQIDLCLAGHTHGGQVRAPWYGPLVIDSKVPKKWSRGFHCIGIPYLNVSAGAGSNRYDGLPPIRLNCPTEMTLIELVPVFIP